MPYPITALVMPRWPKCFGLLFLVVSLLVFTPSRAVGISDGNAKEELVPACLIGLEWEERPAYAFVVEKASQTLWVYEWNNGFTVKHQLPCSTGETPGIKERAGDGKTPEGVYFFTKAFEKR